MRYDGKLYPGVARSTTSPPAACQFCGFTLMELLIVITIIAMLSSMTLVVVGSAQRSARIASTESTVARIDVAVCEMYESYMNRRITLSSGVTGSPAVVAQTRLRCLYDTIRMEMPCNWDEVVKPPQTPTEDPPLRRVYMEVFRQAVVAAGGTLPVINNNTIAIDPNDSAHAVVLNNANAKLLYQIVMNGNPEAREMFGERGIAVAGDGLPYFVDAWGRPICFLRWAPGFAGSDRQPDLWRRTGTTPTALEEKDGNFWQTDLSPDVMDDEYFKTYYDDYDKRGDLDKIDWKEPQHRSIFETLLKYPDPLDQAKVRLFQGGNASTTTTYSRPGFFLIPLVYSAGPDGIDGLMLPSGVVSDPFLQGYGAPFGSNDSYLDNIHNHRLGGR